MLINSYSVNGSAAAGNLPEGALGVWYCDQYSDTPQPHIPNDASAVAVSSSLINQPRRLFANNTLYVGASCTITDSNATAPDASNDASTVVWGSLDAYIILAISSLPAGTYTLAVWVRSTSGSPVQFRMGPNAAMATKTATTSWSRVTHTFSQGAPGNPNLILVRSLDSATPASLAIVDADLFAGASDLGAATLAGHLYLGINAFDNQPAYSAGALDMSASRGMIQFPASVSMAGFTAIAVAKKTGAGATIHGFLFKAQNYADFTATLDFANSAYFQFNASNPVVTGIGLWAFNTTGGWHAKTNRYGGGKADLFLEDVKAVSNTSSGLTTTVADLFVGAGSGYQAKYSINSIALWNRTLTDAEVRTAVAALTARAALSSITVLTSKFLCSDGDSITYGTAAGYPYLFGPNSSPTCYGVNIAQSGFTLADLVSRAASTDAILPPVKNGRIYIYTVLIGANDLFGPYPGGGTQYAADAGAFTLARKNAGWDKVIICTILPGANANHNTGRALANDLYRDSSWRAAHGVDGIVDFAADATMGPDAAALDTSLYSDGVHPTVLGQQNLEAIFRPVINSLS